jgi:hypothetical protein
MRAAKARNVVAAGLLLACLAACSVRHPDEPEFYVRNDTSDRIKYVDDSTTHNLVIEAGGTRGLFTGERCRQNPRVSTMSDRLIAQTDELCGDDIWIIAGTGATVTQIWAPTALAISSVTATPANTASSQVISLPLA